MRRLTEGPLEKQPAWVTLPLPPIPGQPVPMETGAKGGACCRGAESRAGGGGSGLAAVGTAAGCPLGPGKCPFPKPSLLVQRGPLASAER